jgi:putative Mn2+ efflux pump MntP
MAFLLVLAEEFYLCQTKFQMDILTVIILAIGLSMDSFAVSIGCGLAEKKISFRHAMRISFSFAFFQGLLPVAGWFMGTEIKRYVEAFDHWIAFFLLLFLGGKMIAGSFKKDESSTISDIYSWRHIVTLSIATSIDSLVVGFSYALASTRNIFGGALIIGAVTFFFAMLGIRIGKDVGSSLGSKVELIGGFILIGIGLKILIQHTLM